MSVLSLIITPILLNYIYFNNSKTFYFRSFPVFSSNEDKIAEIQLSVVLESLMGKFVVMEGKPLKSRYEIPSFTGSDPTTDISE